ncbi:MAG: portal protein [Nitrososphaera sp.]
MTENIANISGLSSSYGGGLSGTLHAQFIDWAQQRKPQEENMLEDYEHKMRISRDNISNTGIGALGSLGTGSIGIGNLAGNHDTGLPQARRSRVFIGSTRSKIRTARARIKDALFGSGKMPFDAEPSQESLSQYVDEIEKILTYQLDAMNWQSTMSLGIDDLATYGTGFIGGPFSRTETHDITKGQAADRGIESETISYRAPYYERISPMDSYPDPEAETPQDGLGFYWASRKQPEFIRGLRGKPGYNDEALRYALTQKITSTVDEGSDRTRDTRQNLYRYTKDGRIWFLRYFGLVSVRQLAEWQGRSEEAANIDSEERIEAIVQMAGGVVVKADINPYHMMRRPVYWCCYEEEPGEVWGTGVARNNRDNQKVINGSFQLYLEGKAFALLKMCSIDRSMFNEREDFRLFPGKRFDMKPHLTPEERKSAIIWHDMIDVTDGWERAIELSQQFSEDDTGISRYTQGTDADALNKTATGISMIMGASAFPLKEVIGNIDERWIEKMAGDLLQWDMEFLDAATVEAWLGSNAAQAWQVIKRYGKTSFVTLKPSGSSTFMMREVLISKLSGFMQAALGNPLTAQFIDVPELLGQVWDAAEIGRESPVLSQEDIQRTQAPLEGAGQIEPLEPSLGPGSVEGIGGPEGPGLKAEEAEGVEGLAPPGPSPQELAIMEEGNNRRRLEELIAMLIARTDESNRLARADKIPIRNPETGLIERVVTAEETTRTYADY